jgi:hypothetical protein
MRPQTLILFPVLLLGGCATLSETDCRGANWEDIGYRDGADGARRERAQDHAKACAEYGIAVDENAWRRGYEGGLQTYCTPENAVQVAMAGGSYAGVCPPESDREFATHWRAARPVYEQRQRVSQLDNRRRELEYAYSAADNDQERYNVRVELGRVDEQLRHERQRLYYEEDRLNQFLRGIR